MKLEFVKLNPRATRPAYQTPGAGGMDLHACLPEGEQITIEPGTIARIPTGVAIHVGDPGFALFLLPRSGLATKSRVRLANSVGLSDSDYQGELGVFLENAGTAPFTVSHGDRIAQGVVGPVLQVELVEVTEFSHATVRGGSGFGSTGVAQTTKAIERRELSQRTPVYEGELRRRKNDHQSLLREPTKAEPFDPSRSPANRFKIPAGFA